MPVSVTRLLPPDEWVKRQIDTLKDVGQRNYKQGIAMPHKDPIEAGIAAEDKYAARLKAAIDRKARAKGLAATNIGEWYNLADTLGANRLVEGVVKREFKVHRFVRGWHPLLQDHVSKLDQLKVVTDADAENKMLENLRGLKALKGAWRGR